MTVTMRVALLVGVLAPVAAVKANPIRKVVTMLQTMNTKVVAEGEREQDLFDKYQCYCKNSGATLGKSIDDAKTKIPQLESAIKGATGQQSQLENDLKDHKADRKAAKTAIAEATSLREKEAAAFAKYSSDEKADISAMRKAIAALENGMGGGFLQTDAADILRKRLAKAHDEDDADKQELLSFLSSASGQQYAPQSGQITGILKEMSDEAKTDLHDATAAEQAAIAGFTQLTGAKMKEIAALTKLIEEKLQRVGDISVNLATMKNDLDDTKEALEEDEKFLAGLATGCDAKAKEMDERKKMRGEELEALSSTIKVLNDDDALDLFKKTLPSSASSFLQVQVSASEMKARALDIVNDARRHKGVKRHQLDFIALALRGKQAGFDKVLGMVDSLVAALGDDQKDDNEKKSYCASEFDVSDDKKKNEERNIKDIDSVIAEAEESAADLKDQIATSVAEIAALDKSVAEATAQRKAEHKEYEDLVANDAAAKEVILFAKNRLSKFYAPELYKAPPKRELSEEDRIVVNMGGTLAPTQPPAGISGTGITALVQDAPDAPPATFEGSYKKSEDSNGVMAMMDVLVQDLEKELTIAKAEEGNAQADYEKMMDDSKEKRQIDSKSLADKKGALADLESKLQEHKAEKKSTTQELMTTLGYIKSLHADCDWLLKEFSTRKEARANEVDSLKKAKAVLSGADYSLLQTGLTKRALRHRTV